MSTMLKTVNIGKGDKDLQEWIKAYEKNNPDASISLLFKNSLRLYIEAGGGMKSSPSEAKELLEFAFKRFNKDNSPRKEEPKSEIENNKVSKDTNRGTSQDFSLNDLDGIFNKD